MEYTTAEISSRDRIYSKIGILVCAALCLVGAITGTFVYSKSFSDADIAAFVKTQQFLPVDFSELFFHELIVGSAVCAAVILCGICAFGWLFVPAVLFGYGLRLGVSVCCLWAQNNIFGALYAFAVVILPALVRVIYLVMLGNDAFCLSLGLLRALYGANFGGVIRKFVVKIPLCAAFELLASALSALMRSLLFRFIS